MSNIIIIQIAFVILAILEAFHDNAVIKVSNASNTDYTKYNTQWHTYSAMYYAIIVTVICILFGNWKLAICLYLIRLTFFQNFLNVLREKPFFYLSNRGLDKLWQDILGKSAGIIIFIGSLAALVTINFFL